MRYFGYKSRNSYLKSKYGISEVVYNRMLKTQGGRCAICRRLPKGKRLAVDHSHLSGKVRGLLCEDCNRGLGRFGDSYAGIRRAYLYMKKHKE